MDGPAVRDPLSHYPGDVGHGSMPGGLNPFIVPGTDVQSLGSWVLLYVGVSDSKTARIVQYFGKTSAFTRGPGGQSFHLSLAMLFGGRVDPRVSTTPRADSIDYVLRGSLSLTLEARMRDMSLAYVQVHTPACFAVSGHLSCSCNVGCEASLLRRRSDGAPPVSGWPPGARPLLNSTW
jgi:hypothetical protein